jgi:hypothetical protein
LYFGLTGAVTGTLAVTIDDLLAEIGLTRSTAFVVFNVSALRSGLTYVAGVWANVFCGPDGQYAWNAVVPFTWNANDAIAIKCSIPIAQWTSNVNLASDFTEYAYNTSATTTNDTTSFGYGPEGVNIRAFVPVGTSVVIKRVNFKNAIQATDKIELEAFMNGVWVPFASNAEFIGTFTTNDAGSVFYGGALHPIDTFNVDVYFYSRPWVLGLWELYAATYKWRVRKTSVPA